jgi:serine beta-lactamase-like protein LACTB
MTPAYYTPWRRWVALPLPLVLALTLGHPPRAQGQVMAPSAEAPGHGPYAGAVEESREVVAERMTELGIPGFQVAVAREGRLLWSEGFGWADVENRVPVSTSSRFRIASISKALTAGALGRLVERGDLELDEPIQTYLPRFPEKEWPVTTRLLAGHLGGIRHYRGNEFASAVRYTDVLDALAIFEDDPLIHPPGSEYEYSSYGWNLISAVMQEADGRPFLELMYEDVIYSLELRSTVAEHTDSIIPHRARFYQRNGDGRLVNAPFVDNSLKWAGGGYLSTAEDMVAYGEAYLEGRFLQPETIREMWTSQRTTAGEEVGYGIGWMVREMGGRRVIMHTGGAMGGSTVLFLYPEEGVVVSILTNLESARHVDTARTIADLFLTAAQDDR